MPNVFRSLLLVSIFTLLFQPCGAAALDHHLGVEMGWTHYSLNNYFDQSQWRFSRDENNHVFSVTPELYFWVRDGVSGHLQADLTWKPDPDEDEDALEADLIIAYLSLSNETMNVDFGRKLVQFGNGLIMVDDTLAASFGLNRGKTFVEMKAAQVGDNSPMVGLSMGIRPGDFEQLELFGVWFQDNDDIFANSVSFDLQFLDITSSGDLYWIGAAADLFVGQAYLTAVGAIQQGRINLQGNSQKRAADVRAYFADIGVEVNLDQRSSLGAFCFMTSGDRDPLQGDIKAALSILAYNPRAAIFFDDDFMDRDDTENFTYSGVTSGGVIAPGLTFAFEPSHGFLLAATVATFYAQEKRPDGSRWYGWEADLELSYAFGGRYKLLVTAACFQHGDYFESVLGEIPDSATLLSVGVNVEF